ncbi:MAG: MOSC domain-containing protein [Chloroflexota bacterium]
MRSNQEIGVVTGLCRYPVKSMRGQSLREAHLYWHGLDGDRRYAFVQSESRSGFPWLTARELPQLVQYGPRFERPDPVNSPIQVQTPNGRFLPLTSDDLHQEIEAAFGQPIHLMKIGRGAYDSQVVSLVSQATLDKVGQMVGEPVNAARFRQNILIETRSGLPFAEEEWLDGVLTFGDGENAPRLRLNRPIQRCVMVTVDPETAEKSPQILKTIAQQRDNCLGLYGSPERPGPICLGDVVRLVAVE